MAWFNISMRSSSHLLFICLFLIGHLLSAQRIFIDEDISDWNNSEIALYEEPGDNNSLDILSLAIADDENYLYLKIEFDREILLQQDNNLTLEISNADINFSFNFGERYGRLGNIDLFHNNIGLISSPTVSSRIFEIQLSKNWDLGFGSTLELSGEVDIALTNIDSNSDQLPNGNNKITYILKGDVTTPVPSYSIEKAADTDFRFCTYNVLRDNIFESDARGAYTGILQTIDPDVIIFQEIYDHTSSQTLNRLLNVFNALDNSSQWYAEDRGSDNIIISKYPIIYSREVAGNGIFVINRNGVEVMIANIHLPCCSRDAEREREIDRILEFIRDSKAGVENFTLKSNSPIIISGDTNFVGNSDQVDAFMQGDIFNNNTYGSDFEIDWDEDGLQEIIAFTTNRNSLYTWQSDFSSFSAGRLDYIFYSDYGLEVLNSFVLDTEALSSEERQEWNLNRNDSKTASDHLPIVADFKLNPVVSNKEFTPQAFSIRPNPSSDKIYIEPSVFDNNTTLLLYNQQGHQVATIRSPEYNISHFPPGSYYLALMQQYQTVWQKLIIAR